MDNNQKAAILARLESRYIPNYYVSDVRALLAALDECEQRALNGYYGREYGRVVAEKNNLVAQLTEARRLIAKWREHGRELRGRVITMEGQRAAAYATYCCLEHCADELSRAVDGGQVASSGTAEPSKP